VIAAWLVRFRPRQIHAKAKALVFVELKGLPIRAVERFALMPADAVGGGT
jgi:hypothetical protein